jgi:hypothetical protein
LGEFSYSYKDQLINANYTYWCRHSTFWKVVIQIDKENLIKYIYTITSKEKEHSCIKNKQERKKILFQNS